MMTEDEIKDAMRKRRDDFRKWLADEAPVTFVDQKHLDADTPERAYWHHGYAQALDDVLRKFESLP